MNVPIHKRPSMLRPLLTAFSATLLCWASSGVVNAQSVGQAFPMPARTPVPFFGDRAGTSADKVSHFLSTSADAPSRFVERLGRNPSRICDALDDAGFPNLGWKSSASGAAGECLSVTPPVDDGAAEPNSIFYMLRGRGSPRVDYARIKINLPEPSGAGETLARAADLLRAFSAATRTVPPDAVYDGLRKAEPFDIPTAEVSYQLKREYGEPRYNLSIDFRPTPNAINWSPDLGSYRIAAQAGLPADGFAATTAKTSRLAHRPIPVSD